MPTDGLANFGNRKLAYSIGEFCSLVGLSRSKVYQLLAAGELSAVKVGKRTLIRSTEAERFIDARPAAR
jgi:excisionase family DNA binding protein